MISIIVCHRNPVLLTQLRQNIAETIEASYEIIVVDNLRGDFGLCEAYNRGACRSQFDYLCFAHEDILFRTLGWGKILMDILSDETIGLIGVAGGKYKPMNVSSWWDTHGNVSRGQVVQYSESEGKTSHHCNNPECEKTADVVSLDGLFLATKRQIWQQIPFDAATFVGFHFYDIDFAGAISRHHRVVVSYEVVIEHLSEGSISQDWLESAVAFNKKWQKQLPFRTENLRKIDCLKSEIIASGRMIKRCHEEHYPAISLLRCALAYRRIYPVLVFALGWVLYITRLKNQED